MPDFVQTLAALGEGKVSVDRICDRVVEILARQPLLVDDIYQQLDKAYQDRLLSTGLYDTLKERVAEVHATLTSSVVEIEQEDVPTLTRFLPASELGGAGPPASSEQSTKQALEGSGAPYSVDFSLSEQPEGFASTLPGTQARSNFDSGMLRVGDVIRDRFKILDIIGKSGMSRVYKALDLLKEELKDKRAYVAIKVLNEEFYSHPAAFIALQRESSRQQQLSHPNIAAVYDFDRVGGPGTAAYILMEFLEGISLHKYISRVVKPNGGLPFQDAFRTIKELGQALEYAHKKGIVHSDLKPGNCFLLQDKTLKLLDFGIARVLQNPLAKESDKTLFDAGQLGALTPAYASLEMLEGEAAPDPRDDIYALGCVACELLTGHHPFNKLPVNVAKDKGMTLNPIKGLKSRQMEVMRQAVAFERKDRVSDISAWLAQLEDKHRPGVIALGSIFRKTNGTKEAPPAQGRRPWKRWTAAVVVAICLAGIYPVWDYLRQRAVEQTIISLKMEGPGRVAQLLGTLDRYSGEDRQRILFEAGDALKRYYRLAVTEPADPESGQYDFPQAENILKQAAQFYPEALWLERLDAEVANRKIRLLERLTEEYEGHLVAGDLLADENAADITDVLAALAAAAPAHSLLKDPRLVTAYYQTALRMLDKPAQALDYILSGLRLAPNDVDLLALKDRVQKLASLEGAGRVTAMRKFATAERAKLQALLSQPRTGDSEWEGQVQASLWQLYGLMSPATPALDAIRRQVVEPYLPAVRRAVKDNLFTDAYALLDHVRELTGETDAVAVARAEVARAEAALERKQQEQERVTREETLKQEFLLQLVSRNLVAARGILNSLQEALSPEDAFLDQALASFEDIYLRLASDAARQGNRETALALLQEADELAPGPSARLEEAKQEYAQEYTQAEFAPGERFRDCDICPEMVALPRGEFRMGDVSDAGSDDEKPVRKVSLQRPFAVGVYEVLRSEFEHFQTGLAVAPFPQTENHPVVNVTFGDAQAYAEWLRDRTGKPYRLLSEAEWEYAARAGAATKYAFGNDLRAAQANMQGAEDGYEYTSPPGSFPANKFGVHDMHGNVWEWVLDCWYPNYYGSLGGGLAREFRYCPQRVIRGGSYSNGVQYLRSANRMRNNVVAREASVGFRIARTLELRSDEELRGTARRDEELGELGGNGSEELN